MVDCSRWWWEATTATAGVPNNGCDVLVRLVWHRSEVDVHSRGPLSDLTPHLKEHGFLNIMGPPAVNQAHTIAPLLTFLITILVYSHIASLHTALLAQYGVHYPSESHGDPPSLAANHTRSHKPPFGLYARYTTPSSRQASHVRKSKKELLKEHIVGNKFPNTRRLRPISPRLACDKNRPGQLSYSFFKRLTSILTLATPRAW